VKPIEVPAIDFDLVMTLNSGQVFHWNKCGDGFVGTIGDHAIYVEQRGDILRAKVAPASSRSVQEHAQDAHATISHYFALDHPLEEICSSFPEDPILNAAREFCRGLRIIRQPKWECLATFICSSMKQVAHIRQISQAVRERFGKRKTIAESEVFIFPKAARLARANEAELRECALGYRAKNLLATAKLVASSEADLQGWSAQTDDQLRERLRQLPGVGTKVANCVMLFAYERTRAFPIDVWIERVLREKYFRRKRKVTAKTLAQFAASYFGGHGGYAQQYLFHHARMTKLRRSKG